MEKIILENFSAGGECNLFHHGLALDCIERQSLELQKGDLYGIIGEFGNGGAALSCGITGNTNFYEGKILIDDEETSVQWLIENSWYVGNDLYSSNSKRLFGGKPQIAKNTVKQQIELGIQKVRTDFDIDTVKDVFGLSTERINRNIKYVSEERWKASAAIGFVNGKKIFCYPWFNSKDVERLKEQLSSTVKILLDFGCIVIMPTTKVENIEKICSKANIVIL